MKKNGFDPMQSEMFKPIDSRVYLTLQRIQPIFLKKSAAQLARAPFCSLKG